MGSPVLYRKRPACVHAIERGKDAKITIETEHGLRRVRVKDVLLLHPGTVSSLVELLSASHIARISEESVQDAREFFGTEAPSFFELAELLWGASAAQSWAYWEQSVQSAYFVCNEPAAAVRIRSQQECASCAVQEEKKEARQALKQAFIQELRRVARSARNMAPTAQEGMHRVHVSQVNEQFTPFLQEIEAFALGHANRCKILQCALGCEHREQAHEILLHFGFWPVYRNPYPDRLCPLFLSPAHVSGSDGERAAQQDVHTHRCVTQARTDCTHLAAYAIDGEGTRDPDDAISFDGTYFWIHVASPAELVLPDSHADACARTRGASLYLPEGAVRMLSDVVVDTCALARDAVSPALSFKILLDEHGDISCVHVLRSMVRVTRLSYAEADSQRDTPALQPLFDFARNNIARRKGRGAVDICFPDVHMRVDFPVQETGQAGKEMNAGDVPDTQGKVPRVHIEAQQSYESMSMVREFMLLAGEAAARFAFLHNLAFPYVSQERPQLPVQLPAGLAGEYKKRRAMKARRVSTTAAVHAALGLSQYSQVTSPLRRYVDLLAHQQLLACIDHAYAKAPAVGSAQTNETLALKLAQADEAARQATQAERVSRRHWTLVYFLMHPHTRYEAIVLEPLQPRAHVWLPAVALEADVALGRQAQFNERVMLRVVRVRLATLEVHFSVCEHCHHGVTQAVEGEAEQPS
ncbi:ribonuclease catalytic domain-containing protein [Treponema pallidum]|uniref:ribonuclease catalytic domain-containing protein n=1 Tax=Treponema pallidum TaxID=160 RepID=UPI0020CA62C9|nr:ribonuclease R family protein [Treponema pallidum]